MAMCEEKVLCASSAYEEKYYFNEAFSGLPKGIQEELKILCVLFTEEVGGIFTLSFDEAGQLNLEIAADENDLLYDEIGSGLKIKQLQSKKAELFEALELYYRVFFLGESV
jgi:hypothetical protein